MPPAMASSSSAELTLGKLVRNLEHVFSKMSWTSFVDRTRGRSCIAPLVADLPHPAANLLEDLRRVGAPIVYTTPAWTVEQRDAAVERGSHKSAIEHHEFLAEEMADMIEKQYWVVLPYRLVRSLPNLRISPLGVVPQRGRRPRTIVDYSFYGLNEQTTKMARPEAMQFGHALERVLRKILAADPKHGPVYMLKIDLSDGFYRVPLRAQDIPGLAVAFPMQAGEEPHVAMPLVLPMGWTESPPQFSTATETIADLANAYTVEQRLNPPPHPLEHAASSKPEPLDDGRMVLTVDPPDNPSPQTETRPCYHFPAAKVAGSRRHKSRPLVYTDVFVDDEIMVGQGNRARLNRVRRVLLHANDVVFRPNDNNDLANRREPISLKKLLKGDACWATYKIILGWAVDTLRHTIELPPHRQERLLEIIDAVRGRRRCSVKHCQKLLGELRSMVLAIPGGRGLFSQLQHSLKVQTEGRVKLKQAVQDQIEDFWWLANDIVRRPTRLAEIFPAEPHHVGACDAAKSGMGGVWLPKTPDEFDPIVWRWEHPENIQNFMLTDDNPRGTITNSDLELAGTLGHESVITQAQDCRERTLATMCDNTPAVSWQRKGSTSTTGPAAYLLREAALYQRTHRYVSLVSYIPGDWNGMADDASRRFDLDDSQLLELFNSKYPQARSWQMHHLEPSVISSLTLALQRKRPARQSQKIEHNQPPPSGIPSGSHTWTPLGSTIPTFVTSQTQFRSYKYWPTASETGEPVAAATRSELREFLMNSLPSQRHSPTWVSPIRDSPQPATWTLDSRPSTAA